MKSIKRKISRSRYSGYDLVMKESNYYDVCDVYSKIQRTIPDIRLFFSVNEMIHEFDLDSIQKTFMIDAST